MSLVKIRKLKSEIGWVCDPDAEYYETPCKGCVGFCDLEDTDDATGVDFGVAKCSGLTEIRRTTVWFVELEFTFNQPVDDRRQTVAITGLGQSEEEAIASAEVHFVARQLVNDPFEMPASGVRLHPCRSS